MKLLFKLLISGTLILILFVSSLTSCKKDTVYQTNTDTVYVSTDVAITPALIAANKWMIEETRGVSGSSLVYYLRGGGTNTESFDNEYIKFNTDFSATYHDNFGTDRAITWSFANADNTKMLLNFTNTPASFTVTWDNIHSKNGKIYLDEYFTDGNTGANTHKQAIRVPKP